MSERDTPGACSPQCGREWGKTSVWVGSPGCSLRLLDGPLAESRTLCVQAGGKSGIRGAQFFGGAGAAGPQTKKNPAYAGLSVACSCVEECFYFCPALRGIRRTLQPHSRSTLY